MKHRIFVPIFVAAILALGSALPSSGQSTAPTAQARYPQWTGSGYPAARHLAVMLLQFDNAAVNMAQAAQRSATDANVKRLAGDIIAERSRELTTMRSAYQKQYGEAPPAWGGTGGNYGAMGGGGMMGGGPGYSGHHNNGYNNNGYNMMAGTMGQMMTYGDGYQTMMGNSSNWWGGGNAGTAFVPALMRLDAMQISMATLGLQSNAQNLGGMYRTIIATRTSELSRLSKML